jgi:hypothetical protein
MPFLAVALVVAVGCTTKVVNLAVDDGGIEKVSVARADADGASSTGFADADGADSTGFDEAVDAGMVLSGGGHYLQFTCCLLGDGNQCSEERLGGPDACYDAAAWKMRASDRCIALGFSLAGYGLFGSCVTDGGL